MITHISVEIKNFLIARFSNESDFDNLCRKIDVYNTFSGNYDDRITGLVKQAHSNYPDAIQRLYQACITLRPGFKDEKNRLFAVTSPME